jgi:copper(I)-binding protein
MLCDAKAPLKQGDRVRIVLEFGDESNQSLILQVKK